MKKQLLIIALLFSQISMTMNNSNAKKTIQPKISEFMQEGDKAPKTVQQLVNEIREAKAQNKIEKEKFDKQCGMCTALILTSPWLISLGLGILVELEKHGYF